ncbi:TetR/AcrR family transcriptional regulator [Arthrobacter oryzae]|uniref:TetR/AcrR family transcriptional regulator n=1 Tax=Arthrobacter oryzae TaxID=409290 RepID=UPI00273C5ADD|nr:TetR/AcrR family transcriptional regulator [Arthrobacter oryzae]WLQ05752.1 TetR/AcrR family transcriptional regulator [Arthrobacter oryzae]
MPTAIASPSPRRSSGRPKAADSANRREEILAAATELFSIEGFRGVSMSAIARACGISLTGLVHYFPSKELLLQATMDRRDEVDQARIAGPNRARGWAYLESLVDLVRHNQNQKGIVRLFTTVAAEAVDPEHPANTWLRRHHRTSAERIRAALVEASEDGALREDAPAESIARSLIATMDGLQVQWLSDPDYQDMAADFETLLETVRLRWGR